MPVRFKGISEYRNKYRGPKARSRSASPHRRMLLAGLRSDHQGISREPQILSRRKIPTHPPQVSHSLQWDLLSELSRPDLAPPFSPAAAAAAAAGATGEKGATAVAEIPVTPAAPRGPRLPEALGPDEQLQLQPQPHIPSPTPTVQVLEQPINGVRHALMRKAGLRPHRPARGRQHTSEYQRQFEWKERVSNSPLLAAEQALHSSMALPVHASNPVPFESEYSRNFKGSPPPRPPRLRRDVEQNEVPLFQRENVPPEKASKGKRKKKKEQHLERKRHSSKEEGAQCQPISTKQEVVPPKAQQNGGPPPGYRKMKSEYNANFRSPLQYQYKDGAWVKALNPADEGTACAHSVAWYHEVRELREKAELYRRRAWGTHFSRLHFNQIMSDHNHLWEASTAGSGSDSGSTPEQTNRSGSHSSPTIEALDLARVGSGSSGPSVNQVSTRGQPATPTAPVPVQPKLAWGHREEAGPAERTDEQAEDKKEEEEEEKEDKEERDDTEKTKDGAGGSEGSSSQREGGRLPTPKLKTMALAQRTHHDRTTPTTGGAVLVSPPRVRASIRERPSPSPQGKPRSPQRLMGRLSPAPAPSKAEEARSTRTPPAAGLTTMDPLPLCDNVWCGTGVVKEPPKRSPASKAFRKGAPSAQAWTGPCAMLPANRIQGTLRNPEFQHNGNLGLVRPALFVYPSSDSGLSDDDGRMSQISARSAASCSMAAQVLGQALKRKENFWGKS